MLGVILGVTSLDKTALLLQKENNCSTGPDANSYKGAAHCIVPIQCTVIKRNIARLDN